MLIAIPSVFSKTEISKLNQHLAQGEWTSGQTTAGEQARTVKQNQQLADDSTLAQQLGDIVLDVLARHPLFVSAALPLKIFPPMFNRYQGGETYGQHVDNAVRFVPGTATRVRSDLSATLFLSEPEDYEGGELVIEEQFGQQQVKLGAGDMILYPSSSLHQVTPVTSGNRVSVVLWMQSMVRDNEQRAMLFNLDQSVQSLTRQHGHQDENVMQLTALYQNLIRQWADT
ncbi:Fe2+-dependent dioxygenase [Methylophaga thiooxydans]|uniref:Oxidoreductase, 2OG-Fe(II) oxygenase family n=1 Tax=Methylophaga thiooxydans DMS010 TaxID=637616 RepID=C0N4Y4_9GAMM|nr:Fe2+-dependent dioxygenase [Methylophaga thiooxydans]EEF80154.1 oxidoreductase, 2OG-Fe(II) oxygenase family [Methylophaga thiooxydans DMS010]